MEISLDELFKLEMEQVARERELSDPDPVIWRWSPLELPEFDVMLHIAWDYYADLDSPGLDTHGPGRVSFCEAGSGIGTKLYLARHKYGMTEFGFEINPDYIAVARELGVRCEQRDLGNMDNQPIWGAYDIVYVARPFKDDVFESRWEQSVQDAMRPGAVLISAFTARKPYRWTCLYRRPFRGVWVKPNLDVPPGSQDVANRLETSSA